MNNCFVKQLKGDTQNNNLPYLNKFVFKPGAGNTIQFQIASSSPYTKLYAVGGNLRYNDDTPCASPCTMATTSIIKFTAETDDGYAYLDNKYPITEIWKLPTSDVDDIASCANVVRLNMESSTALYGDVSSLGRLSKLKNMNIRYQGLEGAMEGVIVGIINAGRTSAITKEDGIIFTSLVTNLTVTFKNNNDVLKSNNGYFLWSPAATEGQYTIGYYSSGDDSLLLEEIINIDADGNWEIVE